VIISETLADIDLVILIENSSSGELCLVSGILAGLSYKANITIPGDESFNLDEVPISKYNKFQMPYLI
jgi:hypothetical protein